MSWGNQTNPVLAADYRRVADFANEYVKTHSYDEPLKKSGLDNLLRKYNIKTNSTIFQYSDMCYNSTNDGITDKFMDSIHIFERVDYYHYRILGEGYPFTGEIIHYPGRSHEYIIEGEWLNGKIIAWNHGDEEKEKEYYCQAIKEFEEIEDYTNDVIGTEKIVITKQRVNQSDFKKRLLKRYESKCCLCGVSGIDMLIASLIKPWCEADMEERVDVNNGLLLCPNHDWLLDKGFISFDDTGAIIISSKLCHNNQVFMNIDDKQYIEMSDKIKEYIQYHRTNIYRR